MIGDAELPISDEQVSTSIDLGPQRGGDCFTQVPLSDRLPPYRGGVVTLRGGFHYGSGERLAVQRKEAAIVFDRPFRYCPVCAHCLVEQDVGGVLRAVCS